MNVALAPAQTDCETGCPVITGPVPGCTVKVRSRVCVIAPATPVTVTVYDPNGSVLVLFKVTIVLEPGLTGLGLKETVVGAGLPLALKTIGVLNPPREFVPNVICADVETPQVRVAGGGLSNVKVDGGAMIVKLPSEISKKMFPTPSILMRAVLVNINGMTNDSDPSLGVLAVMTVG